jgi:hypothetical protein
MPTFTIERTYDVPHFRQETYEAASIEEALKMDAKNDEWEGQKADWDCCGPERVTGAWEGDRAYVGKDLLSKETV